MSRWLVMAVLVPLVPAVPAHAQANPNVADVVIVARNHALDLRLADTQGVARSMPLMRGMVVQQSVSDNAFLGIGLANIYGRKKGADPTPGDRPPRSRKPAVTFVFKF